MKLDEGLVLATADAPARLGKRALLAGQTVYATRTPEFPPGFVAQPPRPASRDWLATFRQDAPRIYLAVDERLFQLGGTRFAFAIDAYLTWGLKQRGRIALLGGAETRDGVTLQILVFEAGQLVHLDERSLPPRAATFFQDAANAVVAQLRQRWPGLPIVQAGPLAQLGLADVDFIGDKALRGLSYRPLAAGESSARRWLWPGAIALAGLLAYAGLIGLGWQTFTQARTAYQTAAADPEVHRQGGISAEYLQIMEQRKHYLEQPRRQKKLSAKAADIVQGIGAVPGVRIQELKLPAPSVSGGYSYGITVPASTTITPQTPPDVWMNLSVPQAGASAMDQAKAIMELIGANTGLTLRLVHQGWKEAEGRRTFTLEGYLHD